MKTIELFAGIGGFRLAANSLGMKTVWANDLCAKACMVYRGRFGEHDLVQGDVRELLDTIPKHEVLTAGFPCQPFSSAGKKRGIRDPRGTLFQAIVETLQHHQPRFFVLENVKRLLTMERGVHFATILSSLSELNYDIEWRLLNAMHFGLPQNRQRVFIVGSRRNSGDNKVSDKLRTPSIRLASNDDLESLDPDTVDQFCSRDEWLEIENHGRRFHNWGMASNGCYFSANLAKFSSASPLVSLKRVLEKTVSDEFDFTDITLQWIEKNTPVNRFVQGVEIISNQGGGARMGYTIFGIHGVAPTLTATTSRHYERYRIGQRYRRLTNVEYARIQGFPDDHCSDVKVYDQYSLIGNAVPPPMAAWVLSRLNASRVVLRPTKRAKQLELFRS